MGLLTRRDAGTRALMQGQMGAVPELIVSRTETRDSVTYLMSNQARIIATGNGVSFAGTTVTLGEEPLKGFIRIMKWASLISRSIKEGSGIPDQRELDGYLHLRTRKVKDGYMAWYKGHRKDKFFGTTREAAVYALRSHYVGKDA